MINTDGRNTGAAEYREGLARVLADQFKYHEAPHHDLPDPSPGSDRTVLPRAHTLVDIYKLLHQGEFGLGHLIQDPLSFKDLLAREFFRSGPPGNDPLLETISPDGSGLRLNLRPLRRFWVDGQERALETLHQVCLESAVKVKGRPDDFIDTLKVFQELNLAGRLKGGQTTFIFPPGEVEEFIREVERYYLANHQAPVLSHSPVYRQLNRPSYRVVDFEVLKSLFPEIITQ